MFRILLLKIKLLRGKLTEKDRKNMIKKIDKTKRFIPATILFLSLAIFGWSLLHYMGDFKTSFYEDHISFMHTATFLSVPLGALALYVLVIRSSILRNAYKVLIRNSVKNIKKELEAANLLDKEIIITNISNGKEMGFTRDATIVGVIPQKRRFVLFELFVEYMEFNNKEYPIFVNEGLNIVDLETTKLSAINGFHQRGDLVPESIVKKLELLNKNQDEIKKFEIAISDIITPDKYTIFELCSEQGNMQFRSYRFKEILYAVYPKLVVEGNEDKLIEENVQLKQKLSKYKKKIIDLS